MIIITVDFQILLGLLEQEGTFLFLGCEGWESKPLILTASPS